MNVKKRKWRGFKVFYIPIWGASVYQTKSISAFPVSLSFIKAFPSSSLHTAFPSSSSSFFNLSFTFLFLFLMFCSYLLQMPKEPMWPRKSRNNGYSLTMGSLWNYLFALPPFSLYYLTCLVLVKGVHKICNFITLYCHFLRYQNEELHVNYSLQLLMLSFKL